MQVELRIAGRARKWALWVVWMAALWLWATASSAAVAAVNPALHERVTQDVNGILERHGLPAKLDGQPCFRMHAFIDFVGGGGVMYMSYLDHSSRLPLAARAEIIEYFVRLYEQRGGHEYMRLQVRSGARPGGLFKPKPEFELILNHTR